MALPSYWTATNAIHAGELIFENLVEFEWYGNISESDKKSLTETLIDFTPTQLTFNVYYMKDIGILPLCIIKRIPDDANLVLELKLHNKEGLVYGKIFVKNVKFGKWDDNIFSYGFTREGIKSLKVEITHDEHTFLTSEKEIDLYLRESKLRRILGND